MGQNIKELATVDIPSKEAEVKKNIEERKEFLEKIAEINPEEERKDAPLNEKAVPPVEVTPLTKETERKLKPRPQIPVLFVPSSFEIMTKNGWKPVMMRVDKI